MRFYNLNLRLTKMKRILSRNLNNDTSKLQDPVSLFVAIIIFLLIWLLYYRIIASFIFSNCVFCVRQKILDVERGKFKTISWSTSDYWTYFLVYVPFHVFVVTVDYMCVTRNNTLSTIYTFTVETDTTGCSRITTIH